MTARKPPQTPMGAAIRRLREALPGRPTQTQLAERTGLTQPRISDLEAGVYPPRLDEIEALEAAFALPRAGLLIEAGWLKLPTNVEELLAADPLLAPGWRTIAVNTYRTGVERSLADGWSGADGAGKRQRKRRPPTATVAAVAL